MTEEQATCRAEDMRDSMRENGEVESLKEIAEAWNNTKIVNFVFGDRSKAWYEDLPETDKVICPVCGEEVTDEVEKEFTRSTGECGTCDHVRGSIADQRREEALTW